MNIKNRLAVKWRRLVTMVGGDFEETSWKEPSLLRYWNLTPYCQQFKWTMASCEEICTWDFQSSQRMSNQSTTKNRKSQYFTSDSAFFSSSSRLKDSTGCWARRKVWGQLLRFSIFLTSIWHSLMLIRIFLRTIVNYLELWFDFWFSVSTYGASNTKLKISRVSSENIKDNQLDDAYYLPSENSLTLLHLVWPINLPNVRSGRLIDQIKITCSLKVCYDSQWSTWLLQSETSEGGSHHIPKLKDRVRIVHWQHQSTLRTETVKDDVDVSLFYHYCRLTRSLCIAASRLCFLCSFIEFTKTATKIVDKRLPQAARLCINHFLWMLDIDKFLTLVPPLGVVMGREWDALQALLAFDHGEKVEDGGGRRYEVRGGHCDFERLLHIMVPSAVSTQLSLNVVVLGEKMFKSFDELDPMEHLPQGYEVFPVI